MVVVSDLWPEGHTWQGCSPPWFRLSMYVHHLLTSNPVIILSLLINVNLLPEYIVVIADHGEPSMRSPSFNLPLSTLYLMFSHVLPLCIRLVFFFLVYLILEEVDSRYGFAVNLVLVSQL